MSKIIQVFCPKIRKSSIDAVSRVLQSNWIGLGPETERLEQNFLKYIGYLKGEGFALGLNSATAGLHLSMILHNVGFNDKVVVPPITFISTVHAVKYTGATPLFCDVEKETGIMDVDELEKIFKTEPKVKGCIYVHLSGYPGKQERINELCKKYNKFCVEDAAHSNGGMYSNNKKVGNSTNIVVFSMQAVKNMPAGDLGIIVVPTKEMHERAKKYRWCGIDKTTHSRSDKKGTYSWKYSVDEVGYKYHSNDILAAIANEQLKYLEEDNNRRKKISEMYKKELEGFNGIGFQKQEDGGKSSFHFYPMYVDRRDDLMTHLKNNNIYAGVHYVRCDSYNTYELADCLNAQKIEERTITLPVHLHLSDEDVKYVIDVVKKGW